MKSFRGFIKGILLRALSIDPTDNQEGSVWYNGTDKELKLYLDSNVRSVLTNTQGQVVENKTIDGTDATGNNVVLTDADDVSYSNISSGLTATNTQDAIDELDNDIEQVATDLNDHIIDSTDAHDATAISYDNTLSGLLAVDVQSAIDEVQDNVEVVATNLADHISDTIDAHDASAISYDNSISGLAAIDVQDAIDVIAVRSGLYKVNLHDGISSTLPTTTATTIDGITITDGDKVLFTNLTIDNNIIYLAEVIGINITWTEVLAFNNSEFASSGDTVIVTEGDSFANQVGTFNGSNWEFNNKIRLFNGVNYLEKSSLYTNTLLNNSTGNVFSLNTAQFNNVKVTYSLIRNTVKEIGTLVLSEFNGETTIIQSQTDIGGNSGVVFGADENGGNLNLYYELDNTGFDAVIKYSFEAWKD